MERPLLIQALTTIGIALMIVGPRGRIRFCNPEASRLFDYPDGTLVGRPISDLLPVATAADLSALVPPPASYKVVRGMMGHNRQGTPIELAVHITPWRDARNAVRHTLILRDVAADLAAERVQQEQLNLANTAVRGARIGVFEYRPATDSVTVSDIWRELLELGPDEDGDVQLEWRGRVHPDDLATALEPIRLCMENAAERANCEYRLRSRDNRRWRWMRTDVSVGARDDQGNVTRLAGAMTEITEQKAVENALRHSVEQFKSAFEHAPIGKAIVDLDGRFLRANAALCELLGYTEAELLKTDFQTLTHPDDLDDDLALLEELKAGRIPAYQMEKRYYRANGAVMWGQLSVGMVRDMDGMPEQFISQIVDVTEQRRLSELKSEFVATVSHELRTPLTSVLGALSLLSAMDSEPLSDSAQRLLFIAQQNGNRLLTLINDILDFEKFSARQMRFSLSRRRISALVEEAVMTNLASADKYGVRLDIRSTDPGLVGWVDPKRFQQVMANLLSNATKFADRGSIVEVLVEDQGSAVRIAVRNQGRGIPESFRDHIFTPFSQAELSSTRSRGGTGLGLSITKQIVEQTGGTIGFDSEVEGWTTFWFTIPTAEPEPAGDG